MGLSASNFLRTLSSPRELVGEAEKMEEAWYRCIFVAIGQPDELPGSHFPAWESTLNQTR